ncbi:hypothetical protein FRC17_003710 [Serendipita sp. 399]|nr:hypothetical protein FRC17_003710 [Serendipita sp. 399]
MPPDALQESTSLALRRFLLTKTVHFPIDSFHLLRLLIANTPATQNDHILQDSRYSPFIWTPRLKLTDLFKFEEMLEGWAEKWEHGTIAIIKNRDYRNDGISSSSLSVVGAIVPDSAAPRKRKRGEDVVSDDSETTHSQLPAVAAMSGIKAEVGGRAACINDWSIRAYLSLHYTRRLRKGGKIGLLESPLPANHTPSHRYFLRNVFIFEYLFLRAYGELVFSFEFLFLRNFQYSMSPSIHPLPSVPRPAGSVALPSGLGAGGRGKEKAPCRYLHYEVDIATPTSEEQEIPENDYENDDEYSGMPARRKTERPEKAKRTHRIELGLGPDGKGYKVLPPQWLNCDLRNFDCSVLGKFHVIMADPPWDIHMSLPYGTMTDDEMRGMKIPMLQDEGLLFLWVTGRAMELGRDCLKAWGYHRIDEIVWVKTNQLQRVIRTGRTGHWLNHTKEHMLIGVKLQPDGSLKIPTWVNRGLDVDVIVSEVRETSRKPEEVYGLIERLCPGGRKVEIFGRKHNVRPGWLTLGNQLGTDRIYERDVVERIRAKYPESTLEVTPLSDDIEVH